MNNSKRIETIFENLDTRLTWLAKSDSAIEYAPHIRSDFNGVVGLINELKYELGFETKECNEYFK